MIMVSFCWKMNFPHNEIKINSVLLMMSLKLTIKVVAFFLGHPVLQNQTLFIGLSTSEFIALEKHFGRNFSSQQAPPPTPTCARTHTHTHTHTHTLSHTHTHFFFSLWCPCTLAPWNNFEQHSMTMNCSNITFCTLFNYILTSGSRVLGFALFYKKFHLIRS